MLARQAWKHEFTLWNGKVEGGGKTGLFHNVIGTPYIYCGTQAHIHTSYIHLHTIIINNDLIK